MCLCERRTVATTVSAGPEGGFQEAADATQKIPLGPMGLIFSENTKPLIFLCVTESLNETISLTYLLFI